MILSMTGFGRSEGILGTKKLSVEIKSLNSKTFDLSLRLPSLFKEKEFEIRKLLNDKILRGKAECSISIENIGGRSETRLDKSLIRDYISEFQSISPDAPAYEYLKMAVAMPEAVSTAAVSISGEDWQFLINKINEAAAAFQDFRSTEGGILQRELQNNIRNIRESLKKVQDFEGDRLTAVKQRYEAALKDFDRIDETRFYQELAYYAEKLDIQEEKVRLGQHLNYYEDVMANEDFNGKKLGFIAQEIGREINTLGSKANHAEIQKLVVIMKDELEKIKEQTLNVL